MKLNTDAQRRASAMIWRPAVWSVELPTTTTATLSRERLREFSKRCRRPLLRAAGCRARRKRDERNAPIPSSIAQRPRAGVTQLR
jgi:hypothetical protein